MAWTGPTTRATGDLITAAIWNTDVVNNLKAMAPVKHVEFTTNKTITATTEATANTVVAPGASTFEARPILIEFFAPYITTDGQLRFLLFNVTGSANLGFMQQVNTPDGFASCFRRLTPTAASHEYYITAYLPSGTTATVFAGAGGAASIFGPGHIRIRYDEF